MENTEDCSVCLEANDHKADCCKQSLCTSCIRKTWGMCPLCRNNDKFLGEQKSLIATLGYCKDEDGEDIIPRRPESWMPSIYDELDSDYGSEDDIEIADWVRELREAAENSAAYLAHADEAQQLLDAMESEYIRVQQALREQERWRLEREAERLRREREEQKHEQELQRQRNNNIVVELEPNHPAFRLTNENGMLAVKANSEAIKSLLESHHLLNTMQPGESCTVHFHIMFANSAGIPISRRLVLPYTFVRPAVSQGV